MPCGLILYTRETCQGIAMSFSSMFHSVTIISKCLNSVYEYDELLDSPRNLFCDCNEGVCALVQSPINAF